MTTHSFVTGANGFIGARLIAALLERGDRVTGLVRRTSDLRRLVPVARRYPGRLNLVIGDLRDPDSLMIDFADIDYVYHLAAELMGRSEKTFRESIVDGTGNLLRAVRATGASRLRCFVYISSQAAMGPSPTPEPIDETAERRPVSWYGTAKRDAEDLVLAAGEGGLPITILRPVAVYGETEVDLSGGVFPTVRTGIVPTVGFARRTATFVYVGDVVRGIMAAAENQFAHGKTYVLAEGQPRSPGDFAGAAAKAFGARLRITVPSPVVALYPAALGAELLNIFFGGRAAFTRDKYREIRQRYWSASSSAAGHDLGWEAETPLDEGVRRQVETWVQERRAADPVRHEPLKERILKTCLLTFILGLALEAISLSTGQYRFLDAAPWPRWLDWIVLAAFWLIVMGTTASLTAALPALAQLAIGGALFAATELSNALLLDWWEFVPDTLLGDLPGPWLRAVVLGLLIGLLTVVVPNALDAVLFKQRQRTG